MKKETRILTESAILVALATVLSVIPIYSAPLGGSVTLFSMVPILLIAFRHGIKWGCAGAFVYSILQLLLGIGTVSCIPTVGGLMVSLLFDYILAFTALGLAGLFNRMKGNRYISIILGTLTACAMRFACHVISGAAVWYSITKENQWNDLVNRFGMWTYSLIYNAQYMVPETIITLIAAPVIFYIIKTVSEKRKAA